MIDYKRKYYEALIILIIFFVLMNINILLCAIKMEQKDNEIWQQKIEIEDLKEQLDRERIKR